VYLNSPLQKMLDIHTTEEYTFIMEKQLMRNPMLVMLFENSVRYLLCDLRHLISLSECPNL
jgi:hypothetical protein